jgi:hypothetical protein
VNANTNRNISGSRSAAASATNDAIPENVAIHFDTSMRQMVESGLPPTVGYLVLLWEEIRSYCIHAILQQVLLKDRYSEKTKGIVSLSYNKNAGACAASKVKCLRAQAAIVIALMLSVSRS